MSEDVKHVGLSDFCKQSKNVWINLAALDWCLPTSNAQHFQHCQCQIHNPKTGTYVDECNFDHVDER